MREIWQGSFRLSVRINNIFLVRATAYLIFLTAILIMLIMIGGGYMNFVSTKEARTRMYEIFGIL